MDEFIAQAFQSLIGSGPFAVLALIVLYKQNKQVEAKDAQLQAQFGQLLAAFNAGTAALTEVKAELRDKP